MEEKSVKSGLQEIEVNGYSVIAINLRTVEDVDAIIRRCEAIKQNMIDGIPFGCYFPSSTKSQNLLHEINIHLGNEDEAISSAPRPFNVNVEL